MIAGEASGDILGADLIRALIRRFPDAQFEGIGGKLMQDAGLHSFFPLERLSVMGLWEPLKRLPEILRMAFFFKKRYKTAFKPDVFIGIDSPDFNLRLEKILRSQGIKTVHYVGPTVWAWRKGRIKSIKKSVDLMLTLFPFENKIYAQNAIAVTCVGHPLADQIPLESDKATAREILGLSAAAENKILALLPGSRQQELHYLAKPFLETAQWLQTKIPNLRFITSCINEERKAQLQDILKNFPALNITLFVQNSRTVMAASDAILVTSGTAALEAMLIKRPTIVAYKMSAIGYQIAKRLIKIPYIALPNLLAEKEIMPEFIQDQVDPPLMGAKLLEYLNGSSQSEENVCTAEMIHRALKKNAGETAAQAIAELINHTGVSVGR